MTSLGGFFPFIPNASRDGGFFFEAIYRMGFGKLRATAQALLSHERAGHTLQPTALVHEAFLRLWRWPCRIESEEHFYRLSSRAMKQALIDSARGRGGRVRISPDTLADYLLAIRRPEINPEIALALKLIWERLHEQDPRAGDAVWLYYVEEKTLDETCRALGAKPARVRADCSYGVQWITDQFCRES
jgi:RNA polymerase sigma factor (sigma-70 family)